MGVFSFDKLSSLHPQTGNLVLLIFFYLTEANAKTAFESNLIMYVKNVSK